MIGVYAWGIVALMTSKQPIRNRAVMDNPREAMGDSLYAFDTLSGGNKIRLAVSVLLSIPRPEPASIWAILVNIAPKSLFGVSIIPFHATVRSAENSLSLLDYIKMGLKAIATVWANTGNRVFLGHILSPKKATAQLSQVALA